MNIRVLLLIALVALLLGCKQQASESYADAADDTAVEHAEKHADPTYVCPMHPQIVRGMPGSCPICGMDLVEQEVDAGGGQAPPVTVGSGLAFNLGLRTADVVRDTLWKYIETVGRVSYDEDRMWHVHLRSDGWVESLKVRSVGQPVKKGDLLLEYYSPEVLAAQEEYLTALGGPQKLMRRAQERLQLLGVDAATIANVRKQRKAQRTVPVYAPASGVVTAMKIREGMYIKPATELMTMADLGQVWMLVDVFEHQLDWVREGASVDIEVGAVPGRTWEGVVDYIYPELDGKTRSLKVRLKFTNDDGVLKPNMFADVKIYGGAKRGVLVVPRESVILSGGSARVVKRVEDNKYQPVDVVTGMESREHVEVLDGLSEGDVVVTSGQFMIDSESNLKASFSRFAEQAAGHNH